MSVAPPPYPLQEGLSKTAVEPEPRRSTSHHSAGTAIEPGHSTLVFPNEFRTAIESGSAKSQGDETSSELPSSTRSTQDVDMEIAKKDCFCIKSTVMGNILTFILVMVKVFLLLWYALVGIHYSASWTDYVIMSIYSFELLLSMGYFVNYKTLYNVKWNMVTWIIMYVLTTAEIAMYCIAAFAGKKIVLYNENEIGTHTGAPEAPHNSNSTANITTTPATPPSSTVPPKQVYQVPPIESVFLGFLFASTILRVWMSQRREYVEDQTKTGELEKFNRYREEFNKYRGMKGEKGGKESNEMGMKSRDKGQKSAKGGKEKGQKGAKGKAKGQKVAKGKPKNMKKAKPKKITKRRRK